MSASTPTQQPSHSPTGSRALPRAHLRGYNSTSAEQSSSGTGTDLSAPPRKISLLGRHARSSQPGHLGPHGLISCTAARQSLGATLASFVSTAHLRQRAATAANKCTSREAPTLAFPRLPQLLGPTAELELVATVRGALIPHRLLPSPPSEFGRTLLPGRRERGQASQQWSPKPT